MFGRSTGRLSEIVLAGVGAAGAATTDIIGHYVSTIKTLREVDASGVLLEAVADPIRTYLRGRKVQSAHRVPRSQRVVPDRFDAALCCFRGTSKAAFLG